MFTKDLMITFWMNTLLNSMDRLLGVFNDK